MRSATCSNACATSLAAVCRACSNSSRPHRRGRRLRRPGPSMLLGEIFQVALQAIRANKLRSFLTMLGIIIGVGAVITMVALGSGAQKAVQARLQALGPTLLSIYPGQSFRGGIAPDRSRGESGRAPGDAPGRPSRSEEHTSELQSPYDLVCRLLL